jgi:outer membrane protein TolC
MLESQAIVRGLRGLAMLTVASGLVICPAPLGAQSRDVLTLSTAVAEALEHNDRIVNQRDLVEQADLGVRLAQNAFRPKIVPNVVGSFGQTDVSNQTYRLDLTQRFVTGTEMRMGVGTSTSQIPPVPGSLAQDDIRFYNADTTLTLSQPLLRGFGAMVTRRSLTSAELRRADALRQRTIDEQQIAVEVARQYYRVVGQQALVAIARQSLERSRKLLEASQAKLEAGLVSQLDVFRAQQLVAQGEMQLSDAESGVEDAQDQLRLVLGRDPESALEVAADIPDVAEPPMTTEEAVRVALSRRLDLESAAAGMQESAQAIAFSRNQLRPQFDMSLALTRRETAESLPDSFGLDGFRLATFFTISMPVDRTPQVVEYQNALIDRDRRRRELDALQKRIAADVRRALRETTRMTERLRVSEASLEVSRKEVEVAQFRYERGLSNNLDVVTAEGSLLTAETRRIAALAELALSRLSLRATLGILDARKDIASASGSGHDRVTHD